MKPTKEEILSDKLKKQAERVAFEDGSGIMFIRYSFDAKELQEYAEQFHKEKLREELKLFNDWMCSKQYDGLIPTIEQCINDYLKSKK